MKKFAIVLSGCGVYDGSEIQEATLSMLAVARHRGTYTLFAPDMEQHHVINHLNGEEMKETRNVLVESARIARGNIHPLDQFRPDEFDALLMPGGFGAAKNLSSWAFEGTASRVIPDLEAVVKSMVKAGKPVGALCIAPVILATILGSVKVTIGDDKETAQALTSMGATHVNAGHGEVVIDTDHKVVTTPCYMLDATIDQIAVGADNVVKTLLEIMD